MPFALEGRRHADVGDEHLGRGRLGAGDQLVVVAGDADDLEVGLDGEERAHALAHDHVVVGEEDGDADRTVLGGSNPSTSFSHNAPAPARWPPSPGLVVLVPRAPRHRRAQA